MNEPHATPNRRDRQVNNEAWIRSLLSASLFCTVATVQDGWAYQRPSAFYFDPDAHAIYIHGAHRGRAFGNAAENDKVTLCVYNVGKMRTHERAFEFFQEHAGVIVFGRASVVDDNTTKHRVMQATIAKHTPHLTEGIDYASASQDEIDETTVLEIAIETWSGKMKWTADPGRDRFGYDEIPIARPDLPWQVNSANDHPMNTEWNQSLRDNT